MPRLDTLAFHFAVTSAEVALGLLAGIALGIAAGLLVSRTPRAERILSPLVALLQVAPIVILAPLPAMWLGDGAFPKVLFAAALAAVPVALGLLRRDVLAGLRAAPTFAVSAVAVAELVGATKGLGYLVAFGQRQNNTALVLVAIALILLVGIAAYGAVALAERRLVRRPKPSTHPDFMGA